ncbi:hypothetical protein [Actinomadura kijaniata]|uniref:hypothetical protein n=1 Tax=Actinomadura kijaniata TaxID=46161 RepID=UPI0008298863|nr:hypothetical protein [Actinomadura kijaniata]
MAKAPSGRLIEELAHGLELHMCVERLLEHLFPRHPADEPERAGRHRPLEAVVEAEPALREALLDHDRPAITRRWRRCLAARAADVPLLHDLAVLYRERALAEIARSGEVGEDLAVATGLWALLPVPAEHAAARDQITGELVGLHAAQGAHALAAGRSDAARLHLRCLEACRSGPAALAALLNDLGVPAAVTADTTGPRRQASAALDRWCADLVDRARSRLTDPEAIARLPEGIPEDYENAIATLAPLARLDVPEPGLLSTGLGWHNDWCYCLYSRKDADGLRRVLESAREFADRLAPHCVPDRGHLPENRALSIHHLFRGVVADGDPDCIAAYEEALRWNRDNDNAAELLVQSRLRHGDALAGQGRFAAALAEGEAARRIAPADPNVTAFIRDMTGYAAEEGTFGVLRDARRNLESQHYDRVLRDLEAIPPASRFHATARKLRLEAHLGRGMAYANTVIGASDRGSVRGMSLEPAVTDLRQALALADSADDRAFVARSLSGVLNAWAVNQVEAAMAPGSAPGRLPIAAYEAVALLHEAIDLDPGNSAARGNLDDIKRVAGIT